MLENMLEYRKGILFVRIVGSLNKKTINKFKSEVINVIEENGINNIVLNFKYVDSIDFKGVSAIYYLYEICKDGKVLICGMSDELKNILKKSRILNYINKIDNEVEAFNLMKV